MTTGNKRKVHNNEMLVGRSFVMQKQMGAFCVFVLTSGSETSLKPVKIDWDILFSQADR